MPRYRMIHVDHYMCRPIAPFDDLRSDVSGKLISKVPIIRIFGADSRGHKICLHVHGFYPYVAIQNSQPDNKDLGKKIVSDVERALEENVKDSRRKFESHQASTRDQEPQINPELVDPLGEQAEANLNARIINERRLVTNLSADQRSPIHRIEPLQSFNYYGYHHKQEGFLKLYLYNPRIVKQLALIFEDCKVLEQFIPVFWAHLPYILLFFIDNNLRGMQFIELDQVYWRKGKAPSASQRTFTSRADTEPGSSSESSQRLDNDYDNDDLDTTDIEPISTCELEADVRYEWIANRKQFGANGNDDALRELWLDDQETSQATSLSDAKLPLFDLERNYIQQLCECYGVNLNSGELVITDRPRPIKKEISDDSLSDDAEYHNDSEKQEEEDLFSDDDEFILKALSQTQQFRQPSTSKSPNIRRRTSDNSMIDGRSIVCSSSGQNRSRSQRSSSSTRETVSHEYQYLCLMTMELHATTRGKLRPNPACDPIEAIFYCIRNDVPEEADKSSETVGVIMTDPFKTTHQQQLSSPDAIRSPSARSNVSYAQKMRALLHKTGLSIKDIEFNIVDTEIELITSLIETVKLHDPELLIGYEMEQFSWGYILERSTVLNINVSAALGRVIDSDLGHNSKYVESNFVQPIMFSGRMVFSTWRIIRHDIHLNTWSYEKIHEFALGERVPCFDFDTLTKWFNQHRNRWRVVDYYLIRVLGQMRILDRFDLIAKVSELARVYGTQFIDVMTRGSQIGIESMMLRLAKLQNLTPLSPTVMQRNKMKAPEALPLVMEPETNIYYDPVAVLDFQSLYPSVVIAYNYCYSTCLGRVTDLESKERHNFGCSQLYVEEDEIKRLLRTNSVHVSPCGVAYVKKNIRHGILPKMLSELIVTRAMVKEQMKSNMKSDRPNRRLQRILDHRQHGLKMMANTTYGYAGASYTGRMPCVEIADSIVSKGRETLENAIELVESKAEWGAKVIYGDTDSIFIQFKDCDRDTAFTRSYEMVEAITAANPHPIKMKFEKIYQPCVLQTKKRYCGFKYESRDQMRPEFEAKGIETVRRDCCPAAARMLEMALRIQFTTRDIQEVKKYVQHQFIKIMSGKLSNIQDFIFARQYKPRDMTKNESVFVPAWQITKRLTAVDPRAEPRVGERVPFVIIYGEPRTPLVNLAKTPMEVLANPSYRVNADYYIQKIICPTLNRIFCTMKVDTLVWYKSMPHRNVIHRSHYLVAQKNQQSGSTGRPATMSQYFSPSHCPVCAKSVPFNEDICDSCGDNLQSSVIRLTEEISKNQRKLFAHHQICKACSSLERDEEDEIDDHFNPCISYDCQNLFRYYQAKLDALNSNYLTQVLRNIS